MEFTRRSFLRLSALGAAGLALPRTGFGSIPELRASDFGTDFKWGVATASFQNEGAWNLDGKGPSIWDTFSQKKGNIKDGSNAMVSCNFYQHYKEDVLLLKSLGMKVFRFSISWSRIYPDASGQINQPGIDFYSRLIDTCLENEIEPWITCYHWDLPQWLEEKGGWTERMIVGHFENFVTILAKHYGDRVKNWMVLNEPLAFTGVGYMWGIHAPGKRGFRNFFPAVHHASLCQSGGARVLRNMIKDAHIGTTFSCSPIDPMNDSMKHIHASERLNALFNRLFVEPAAGLGYPFNELPALHRMERYIKDGDEQLLPFNFDFAGIQNYFRIVGRNFPLLPMVKAWQVPPAKRDVPVTSMNTEIYPHGMYRMLKQFSTYGFPELYVTENGAPGNDVLENGQIHDRHRIDYLRAYLESLLRAKNEGIPVKGYLVWTFMDNFEWAEGYKPRMGLVYVDFPTGKRYLKDSALWFRELLAS